MPIWTPEEDDKLRKAIRKFGRENWKDIEHYVVVHTARECRDRYHQLDLQRKMAQNVAPTAPSSHTRWSKDEDKKLCDAYIKHDGVWAKIVPLLPSRTEAAMKSRHKIIRDKNPIPTSTRQTKSQAPKEHIFTMAEDATIYREQANNGPRWTKIAATIGCNSTDSVQKRTQFLLSHPPWSADEDDYLTRKRKEYGSTYKKYQTSLPYRMISEIEQRLAELKGNAWTGEEDKTLEKQWKRHGTKWGNYTIRGRSVPSLRRRLEILHDQQEWVYESEKEKAAPTRATRTRRRASPPKPPAPKPSPPPKAAPPSRRKQSPPEPPAFKADQKEQLKALYMKHNCNWTAYRSSFPKIPIDVLEKEITAMKRQISDETAATLFAMLKEHKFDWSEVGKNFIQSPSQLYHYYHNSSSAGKWSSAEIEQFTELYGEFGEQWQRYQKSLAPRRTDDIMLKWYEMGTGWSYEEDIIFDRLVTGMGPEWDTISTFIGRSARGVQLHWQVMHPGINPVKWTRKEDKQLAQQITTYGDSWEKFTIPGRAYDEIAIRGMCHEINNFNWMPDEDIILARLTAHFQNSWQEINQCFPQRTSAAVSSHWYKINTSKFTHTFTPDQDGLLFANVHRLGPRWEMIQAIVPVARIHLRERYREFKEVQPPPAPWTDALNDRLLKAYAEYGSKSAAILRLFPGYTTQELDEQHSKVSQQRPTMEDQAPKSTRREPRDCSLPEMSMPTRQTRASLAANRVPPHRTESSKLQLPPPSSRSTKAAPVPKPQSSTPNEWNSSELALLKDRLASFINWKGLTDTFNGKSVHDVELAYRFMFLKDSKKDVLPFSDKEDQIIRTYLRFFGVEWGKYTPYLPTRSYDEIAKRGMELMASVSSQQRSPPWSKHEHERLENTVTAYGFNWVKVASVLTGRTDEEAKTEYFRLHPEFGYQVDVPLGASAVIGLDNI